MSELCRVCNRDWHGLPRPQGCPSEWSSPEEQCAYKKRVKELNSDRSWLDIKAGLERAYAQVMGQR